MPKVNPNEKKKKKKKQQKPAAKLESSFELRPYPTQVINTNKSPQQRDREAQYEYANI